jgi:hypothetical protein
MGLVEACDAHQDGFNVESCFYLNPQKDVNIILNTRRGAVHTGLAMSLH